MNGGAGEARTPDNRFRKPRRVKSLLGRFASEGGRRSHRRTIPRLTYIISIKAKKGVDLRNVGNNQVLNDVLQGVSDPDDLGPSQEFGAYLVEKE
jgi:hypothetical protein